MKLKEFWEEHRDTIETAVSDYLRWFEEGEENYDKIMKTINDLNEIKDLE